MDKENGKSIDDMLKLLKNKVENSDTEKNVQYGDSDSGAELDTESLKERLRAQYSVDQADKESASDEYALDEGFIASVADELKEIEDPIEKELESQEIPVVVEEIVVSDEEEEEPFDKEDTFDTEEPESEDENFNEDNFFEDEFSSNIMYADDIVGEIDQVEEIEDTESIFEENDKNERIDLGFVESVTEAVNDEDDDLPWFDDEPMPEAADDFNDSQQSVSLFADEEAPVPLEEIAAEVEKEQISDIEIQVDEEPISYEDISVSEDFASQESPEDADDEQLSFYRTITAAEHETMARIAAKRELGDGEEETVDATGGEYDFGDGELFEEEAAFNESDTVAEASEFNIHEALEKKYGISADFYGANEGFAATQFAAKDDSDDDIEEESTSQKIAKVSLWYITKPILMGVIALFIFLIELLPMFDVVPGGLLDYTVYPAIYVLIDLQLVLFISALCVNKLIDGFNRLLVHTPNTYSILLATVAITVVYDILICFCTRDGIPNLYGSIIAFYILLAQVIDILDRRRVNRSLSALLMGDGVYTLSRSQGKNSCAEKMYAGGVAPDTNIYEPREIKGTSYVKAFNKDREYNSDKSVNYAITPVFIFSALMAVGAMVLGEEFKTVLSSMLVTFIALAPLSAMLSAFLPIYVSYSRLYNRGCFITGHKAAQSVGDCDAMVFGDRHLFKKCDPKENGIKLYNDRRAEELLSCLDAVYSAIGGPMKEVFSGASSNKNSRKVTMVRITRSGLEAIVDDRINIILGTAEYMNRYGIATDGAGVSQPGIIYVAMNSLLSAKISLNYKTEPLFEALSGALGDNKIETVIHTYDPAIYGAYVAKCRKGIQGTYPISVVHKNKIDYYSSDSAFVSANKTGAFAISSRLKLVEVMIFCKKILKVDKLNALVRYISFGFMAVLSTVLMITGTMQYINLCWVLLHQVILAVAFALISVKILPHSFEDMK